MLNINLGKIASCIAAKKFNKLEGLILPFTGDKKAIAMIYEIILQAYLFCGFPATLESLKAFHSVFPQFNPTKNTLNFREFKAKGVRNCKKIYGSNYKKLLENVARLSPDMNEWMIIEGYGKMMGRKGLTLKHRELVNVAFLCTNYYEVQLHSHIRGAYNTGADYKEISDVIKASADYNMKRHVKKAMELLNKISYSHKKVNKVVI